MRDTLDLMRELGGAEERSDLSSWHQPSISEHPQNKHYHDWTALIDLVRDAWLATAANSPERARLAAEAWWHTPYPLFRRLAFFAASQDQVIPHRRGLDWLLADQHWWLWSVETNREAMRLLVALAPQLDEAMLGKLVQAILAGPPRAMFKDDMEPERRDQRVDWETWRRLVKIVDTGALLNTAGRGRLEALSASYPKFQLQLDQRDEFLIWQGEVQREGEDNQRQQVVTPRRRRELIDYLKKYPNSKDDFRQRCRDNFATTACALYALASQGDWVAERWREGLQAWREEKLAMRSWRYLGPVLAKAPEDVLQALSDDLSWWLQTISETFDCHEADFFALIGRVLDLDHQDRIVADEPVMRAINHPVGHVTEALLCWWCRQSLQDGQGLLAELVPIFSRLCDTQHIQFRHGRVVLANNAITLFRVDPDWTSQHLLPLFEWQRSATEAQAAWQGFLRSARLYRPLMELLNQDFLNTASYYTELGEHGRPSYASLLTFAALEPGDTFTRSELALATRTLPPDGLHQVAKALVIALEGAGDQRTNYWRNRINPYLKSIWPTTLDIRSAAISASFALLCVASHDAFPEALDLQRAWLLPQEHPDYLVHKLHEAQICSKFSRPALEFLKLVIDWQAQWPPSDLNTCLNVILEAEPELRHDQNYNRLMEYLRIQRTDVPPD